MERLSAPERTREELRALMNGELGTAAGRSELARLALRLIVEEALEGEVADVLGRSVTSAARGRSRQPKWLSARQSEDGGGAVDEVSAASPDTRALPRTGGPGAFGTGRRRELTRLASQPHRGARRQTHLCARSADTCHRRGPGQRLVVAGGDAPNHAVALRGLRDVLPKRWPASRSGFVAHR